MKKIEKLEKAAFEQMQQKDMKNINCRLIKWNFKHFSRLKRFLFVYKALFRL